MINLSLEGASVLLIEDDPNVRRLLPRYFERAGAVTSAAAGGLEGLDMAAARRPDLVLLDVNLPDIDGWSTLKRLRQQYGDALAVIMLTGRSDVPDRLLGLELGADDYIVKPFEPEEVVARARAVLRRMGRQGGGAQARPCEGICVDMAARAASVDGVALDLTVKEFDLLSALWGQRGRVVSREALAVQGWPDDDDVDPHAIDVYISRIRAKLQPLGAGGLIATVRGVGYRLDASATPGATASAGAGSGDGGGRGGGASR